MYVRIARFEGAQGDWDERIEEVGRRMRSPGKVRPWQRYAMRLAER